MVFDADTLESVGEIPNTAGVHGVALAPDLGRGFTSNGRASTVTIFDLKTLKPLNEVKVTGENPDAILYDGLSKQVFAFNGRSANVTVLDAATGKVNSTVALGGKPEFAVTDLDGRVYVNIEDKSEVVVLDARKPEVLKRWPLAPCEEPSGMAIDRATKRLFIGCDNRMMVMLDAVSGRVVATVPIGEGVDGNGFDPGTGLAFSSNGEGNSHGRSRGLAGQAHRSRRREDAARRSHDGARREDPSGLPLDGRLWAAPLPDGGTAAPEAEHGARQLPDSRRST